MMPSRIIMVAFLVCSCSSPSRTPRLARPGVPHIKVMSYNVNFGLAGDRSILEAIEEADCDVVFLQETTPKWERALRRALGKQYGYIEFRHFRAAGGLGILSKFAFAPGKTIPPPEGGWFPGWPVVLDTPLGKVQVLNVHLRPQISDSGSVVSGYFTTEEVRERQIKRFFGRLSADLPTLVVGDFNESGGDALEFLAGRGLTSALNEFRPGEPTWRWNTSVGEVTSQLDHLAFDRRLEPLDTWVIQGGRSDHLPVVGVFVLAQNPPEKHVK